MYALSAERKEGGLRERRSTASQLISGNAAVVNLSTLLLGGSRSLRPLGLVFVESRRAKSLVCVPFALSFSRAIPHFIRRTDVLLACVRECVKNMHARATQTHSCCFCFDRCLCARHTVTHYTAATHNRARGVILFPSSPCLPNQSIATVFTLHSIWPSTFFFFSLTECQSPTFVDTLRGPDNGGLTHTRTLAWDIQPTQRPPSKDPPRLSCFWRRRRRLWSFVLSFALCFPSRASDTGSLDENR